MLRATSRRAGGDARMKWELDAHPSPVTLSAAPGESPALPPCPVSTEGLGRTACGPCPGPLFLGDWL